MTAVSMLPTAWIDISLLAVVTLMNIVYYILQCLSKLNVSNSLVANWMNERLVNAINDIRSFNKNKLFEKRFRGWGARVECDVLASIAETFIIKFFSLSAGRRGFPPNIKIHETQDVVQLVPSLVWRRLDTSYFHPCFWLDSKVSNNPS